MLWLLLIVVVLALVLGPTLWVHWVMRAHSDEIVGMPGTGGELAEHLLNRFDVDGAGVELTPAARQLFGARPSVLSVAGGGGVSAR